MVGGLWRRTQPQTNPVCGNILADHNRPVNFRVLLEGLLQTLADQEQVWRGRPTQNDELAVR
jgi:hypothetical protein